MRIRIKSAENTWLLSQESSIMPFIMSTASKIIIGSAIFSAAIPVLGFPGFVKDGLVVVLGLMIAGVTYWAEKHARFCPECNLPDTAPHSHDNMQKSGDSSWGAGAVTPDTSARGSSTLSSPPSPRSDITPRNRVESPVSASMSFMSTPAPSPFSFDAETEKQKAPRRGGRRKTTVIS